MGGWLRTRWGPPSRSLSLAGHGITTHADGDVFFWQRFAAQDLFQEIPVCSSSPTETPGCRPAACGCRWTWRLSPLVGEAPENRPMAVSASRPDWDLGSELGVSAGFSRASLVVLLLGNPYQQRVLSSLTRGQEALMLAGLFEAVF